MARGAILLLAAALLLALSASAVRAFEVDATCALVRVVDGDTLEARGPFPCGRIRLADVNAPELSTPEGRAAKEALARLLASLGPELYLDVDDVNVVDKYNRTVAVVYVRYNETHLLNVNAWLVAEGYASFADYSNEFSSEEMQLFARYPASGSARAAKAELARSLPIALVACSALAALAALAASKR